MNHINDRRGKLPEHSIPVGLALLALFWLADSFIGALVFHEGTLFEQLLIPSARETIYRLLVMLPMIAFALYFRHVIKQRKQLEAQLHEAVRKAENDKQQTEAILESIGDAISIQTPDLKVIYQNKAHKSIMGDQAGEYCYSAYFQKERPCDGCHLLRSFQDGNVHRHETIRVIDGMEKTMEVISSIAKDAFGKNVVGIEIARDITTRKKAEESVERQAHLLQKLIDTIPNPIFYKNTEGIFLGCNAAFEDCIGFQKDKVIGSTFYDLVPKELAEAYSGKDRDLFNSPGVQIYETVVQCANGGRHEVIFNKASFTDSNGEVAGLVAIVVDITERKQAEDEIRNLNADLSLHAAELDATNKELEAFSYSASHDLRTPLTRIYSSGQALAEYAHLLDENGKYFVRTIIEASEQMEELIEALLVLSKVTRIEMRRELVNLSILVEEIVIEMQQLEPERKVFIDVTPGLLAWGDQKLLRIVLENLLRNSWKYTRNKAEPKIEFGVTDIEEDSVYFVRDNGIGFDMHYADKLFKPFQRLHNTNEFPGTGIGLATVQRSIQRHQGRVWGEGEPDNGATFFFTLNS